MIAYSSLTLKQLIDEAVLRLGPNRTATNMDWLTMVKYANRAIREVMFITLPYKDWAYISTINVTHMMMLPQRFIKPVRVMLSEDGYAPYREARRVDVREYFGLTNWEARSHWTSATEIVPVYMIWGRHLNQQAVGASATTSDVTIYLAPNTDYQTGDAPSGYVYNTADWSGVMDCYLAPEDISGDSDIVNIPYEFEELVIYLAMKRFLARDAYPDMLKKVESMVMQEFTTVYPRYIEKRRTEKESLEEYQDPVQPIVGPDQAPGEVPYKL